MSEIIPISDEQAKAVQEAFKFGSQSLETARAFGGYFASILGTVPEDLVGLLGGDWLRFRRAENLLRIASRARERLRLKQVNDPRPASLAVAVPLLKAAADEDREELVDLWARLLAAAMDPARSNRVRQNFTTVIGQMDPLDAQLLTLISTTNDNFLSVDIYEYFSSKLKVSRDEIEISLRNLSVIGCVYDEFADPVDANDYFRSPKMTALSRQMLRILEG